MADEQEKNKSREIHFWTLPLEKKKSVYINLDGYEQFAKTPWEAYADDPKREKKRGYFEIILSAAFEKALRGNLVTGGDVPLLYRQIEGKDSLRSTTQPSAVHVLAKKILGTNKSPLVSYYKAKHNSPRNLLRDRIQRTIKRKTALDVETIELISDFLTRDKQRGASYYSLTKIEEHIKGVRTSSRKEWAKIQFPIVFDNFKKVRMLAEIIAYLKFRGTSYSASVYDDGAYSVQRAGTFLDTLFGISKGEQLPLFVEDYPKKVISRTIYKGSGRTYERYKLRRNVIFVHYLSGFLEEDLEILYNSAESRLPEKILSPQKYFGVSAAEKREIYSAILRIAFENMYVGLIPPGAKKPEARNVLLSTHNAKISSVSKELIGQVRDMLTYLGFNPGTQYNDDFLLMSIEECDRGDIGTGSVFILHINSLYNLGLLLKKNLLLKKQRKEILNLAYLRTYRTYEAIYHTLNILSPDNLSGTNKDGSYPTKHLVDIVGEYPPDLKNFLNNNSKHPALNLGRHFVKLRDLGVINSIDGHISGAPRNWHITNKGIKYFSNLQKFNNSRDIPTEACLDAIICDFLKNGLADEDETPE